ncbi:cuticle protein 64-like isoform X2 [Microplitis demolitor]|nr:cuticle protein 64-like isoform X2 [Microplitis demolitor]XP_053594446.1 cuticle protein 64-like isoform X2 [Microplitis demolitor]
MLFALASPIFGEDAVEPKKQEKRGVIGLGYPGYSGHYVGGHAYGYNGLGHGYVHSPYYPALSHGAVSPLLSHSAYTAPVAPVASVAPVHGYNGYHSPLYTSPLRLGYHGLGHGLGYYNNW